MRRRRFIKSIGTGISTLALSKNLRADKIQLYEEKASIVRNIPNKLNDIMTADGDVLLRLEISGGEKNGKELHRFNIEIENADVKKIKNYFFEKDEDQYDPNMDEYQIYSDNYSKDVVVHWLKNCKDQTRIKVKGLSFSFTIRQLISNREMVFWVDKTKLKFNYLLDWEINEIDLSRFNVDDSKKEFTFVVMADPQGGDSAAKGNNPTRMKIHNAFIEESVALINRVSHDPSFTLILGDIVDAQGQRENFVQMHKFFESLEMPVLYAIGNHESKYKSKFEPGYNFEAFNNYFSAQKAMNGMDELLYSFNLGNWHFIVWPDPLRTDFWENHPHYFDWLESDLEKNKNRPTIVFHHVPVHPVGINPLINYCESVYVKRTFMNLITNKGNVKYVLSGHVHIPIKASFKTAVSIKGVNFINLPAAGYRPRAFGEEEFYGGPTQGVLNVKIREYDISLDYHTVTGEVFRYPAVLPEFDARLYKLWFNNKWELPAEKKINNGSFKNGLSGWTPRYIYQEDKNPSNLSETRSDIEGVSSALYLFTKKRDYDIPGQDRLPQTINRVCQAVNIQEDVPQILSFKYMIENESELEGWNGAYVWLEGFSGSFKSLNLIYSVNKIYFNIGGKYAQNSVSEPVHFDLSKDVGKWQSVKINFLRDYFSLSENGGKNKPGLDRLVINLGTWHINDGGSYPIGVYFTDFLLEDQSPGKIFSTVNNARIVRKNKDDEWWLNKIVEFNKFGGEHRYHLETIKR